MIKILILFYCVGNILCATSEVEPSICEGLNAGILAHPDPASCYKFISCLFGEPTIYECADGYIFDRITLRCVEGSHDQCPSVSPTTTENPTTINPGLIELCQNVSYGFFNYDSDCGKFVFCSLGYPNVYNCPAEQVFSLEDSSCLPGNSTTCEIYSHTTTVAPTTRDPFRDLCLGILYKFIPHPDECSSYIMCVAGRVNVRHCQKDHVFDDDSLACLPGNAHTCEIWEKTTTRNPIHELCANTPFGYVPHPTDCNKYIMCYEHDAHIRDCYPDLVFNPETLTCLPGNVETCEIWGITTTESIETICVGKENGYFVNPSNCNKFVLCSEESLLLHDSCPAGFIFVNIGCYPGNAATCEIYETASILH